MERKGILFWFRKIGRWIFLVLGIGWLAAGVGFTFDTLTFLHRSISTSGQITSLVSRRDQSEGPITYAPVFSFTSESGRSYVVTSNASSNPPAFSVGQKVTVLYKVEQPDHARLNTFEQLWLFPVMFTAIGTVSFVVGIFLTIYERRKRQTVTVL